MRFWRKREIGLNFLSKEHRQKNFDYARNFFLDENDPSFIEKNVEHWVVGTTAITLRHLYQSNFFINYVFNLQ